MRFQGHAFRAHNPKSSWTPLSGEGARRHDGRFNSRGLPALYTSVTPLNAIREVQPLGRTENVSVASDDELKERQVAFFHYLHEVHEDYATRQKHFDEPAARDLLRRAVRHSVLRCHPRQTIRFRRTYLLNFGFLDGSQGLIFAFGEAQVVRTRYRKLAELRGGCVFR